VILFRNWPQMPNVFELNPFNTHSCSLQFVGVSAQVQTLGHQSPSSNIQWRTKIKLFR
jgi:hypothetical protein